MQLCNSICALYPVFRLLLSPFISLSYLLPTPIPLVIAVLLSVSPSLEVFFLLNSFTYFTRLPQPSFPLTAVSRFSVYEAVSLLFAGLFCSQISHTSDIIWYMSFSDWLCSLSITFSRSVHAVAKGKISFFFYGRVKKYVTALLSTHLPIDIQAASKSWLLWKMLQWAQGCTYSFKLLFRVYLDIFPEVELLGHKIVLFLIVWGHSILFSTVAAPVCIPTNSARGGRALEGVLSLLHALYKTEP